MHVFLRFWWFWHHGVLQNLRNSLGIFMDFISKLVTSGTGGSLLAKDYSRFAEKDSFQKNFRADFGRNGCQSPKTQTFMKH